MNCNNDILQMGKSPFINSNRERVLDPLTAFRLQSMMRGVVERGTAKSVAIKGVEIAGKTGTTNDAKDVWFVGFTRNIVAGCYIGFDTPQPLRKGASGGGMCGPVFKEFMVEAIKKYGSGSFSKQYQTFMGQVNDFERMILESGIHLVKIYMSISKKEQSKRFDELRSDPLKQWKMSPVDERAQELWDEYTNYKQAMFEVTDTEKSPWRVIKANRKTEARVNTITHILKRIPYDKDIII